MRTRITIFGLSILFINPGNCSCPYMLLGKVLAVFPDELYPRLNEDKIFLMVDSAFFWY
jgi:hypothetical protein